MISAGRYRNTPNLRTVPFWALLSACRLRKGLVCVERTGGTPAPEAIKLFPGALKGGAVGVPIRLLPGLSCWGDMDARRELPLGGGGAAEVIRAVALEWRRGVEVAVSRLVMGSWEVPVI